MYRLLHEKVYPCTCDVNSAPFSITGAAKMQPVSRDNAGDTIGLGFCCARSEQGQKPTVAGTRRNAKRNHTSVQGNCLC